MKVSDQAGADPGQRVSLIMACRNEASEIEGCIESILQQEGFGPGWELLVADGLSDDGTRALLEGLARRDGRIRIIQNEGRFGVKTVVQIKKLRARRCVNAINTREDHRAILVSMACPLRTVSLFRDIQCTVAVGCVLRANLFANLEENRGRERGRASENPRDHLASAGSCGGLPFTVRRGRSPFSQSAV